MIRTTRARVRIACFFLGLLLIEGLVPSVAWALTSGPAQPETRKFEPAGTSDMIDMFTGDFKYNVPLLDVGGYPVNLNYQSGVGMDDEASWVGLGWTLNAGAMNRQIRGVADDSDGDTVVTENDMKPKITIGGSVKVRGELLGGPISGSVSVGIFSDNYMGIGAEFGLNGGAPFLNGGSSPLTLNLGFNSSTSSGVDAIASISASARQMINDNISSTGGLSLGRTYNTREGLKSLTLSHTYTPIDGASSYDIASSTISFNLPVFYPKSSMNFTASNYTYSGDVGPGVFGSYLGYGVTGYKTKRVVQNKRQVNKAYGLMYAEHGSGDRTAMMDFFRERDVPISTKMYLLPTPVATPDLFSYSSQFGSGQIKAYRHSGGIFFDGQTGEVSDNNSLSLEVGYGTVYHGGLTIHDVNTTTTNGKWGNENAFAGNGDFNAPVASKEEGSYFRQVGERSLEDPAFFNRIQGEEAVHVALNKQSASNQLQADFKERGVAPSSYKKEGRQLRRTSITYLTAEQATRAGFAKTINSYPENKLDGGAFSPNLCVTPTAEPRVNDFRRKKHISEMTVTGDDGKRMVYGLPVYNKQQEEYSFATSIVNADLNNNLVTISKDGTQYNHKPKDFNGNDVSDEYYHKEEQPPHATSYLLTAVLSPDYVDIGNDGITDDDRGTAIKFNYSKVDNFQWRTPYAENKAQFNRGLNADPEDDKASFVWGKKELWYLNSIESKTQIAYFITEDRKDALGADVNGKVDKSVKQKLLKEIRLFSKSDLSKPIKTVVFDYDYKLCPGLPNGDEVNSKLTLTKVYFKYAGSERGKYHPYKFNYEEASNAAYALMSTDGWGTYKSAIDNPGGLRNEDYPYALQDKAKADANAKKWHLSEIVLPTGGKISVDYESDDYAYVQDRHAMAMQRITGMYDDRDVATPSLLRAKSFEIDIPGVSFFNTVDFIRKYLNGNKYMYVKMFVCMSDIVSATQEKAYDDVPVYAAVKEVKMVNGKVRVWFEDEVDDDVDVNAIASAAWQRMRTDYPRYAFPGYKNRITSDRPVAAAVSALANSIKNLTELLQNFNERANDKNFAQNVKLERSFVRVGGNVADFKKGGGVRVKRVRLLDSWNNMTGDQDDAVYGQEYDYTIEEEGVKRSSGVAAYEPAIGGDENPMRLPMKYEQRGGIGLNYYFYQEEPACEALFPRPQVGYRQVKVRNVVGKGSDAVADTKNRTGWLTYEFYTAKEFPVMVDATDIYKDRHQPLPRILPLITKSVNELAMSQGYAVILNDMHGKPKAERVFNQSGQEVSSTEYVYAATEEGGHMRLNNKVNVVDNTGNIINDQVIGREVDIFTDMRESVTSSKGNSLTPGVDVVPVLFAYLFLPHVYGGKNDEYRRFRSSCVVKTIQYYGVMTGVIKKLNGAQTTSSHVLFDKYTGEPVLTVSENEFKDPVYTLSLPAYWIYDHMGMAYQTAGMVFDGFKVDDNAVPVAPFKDYLTAGDELINVDPTIGGGLRSWVVNSAINGTGDKSLRLVDVSGRLARSQGGKVVVYRSGYRNILSPAATSITSLVNPVEGNKLKVISAGDLSRFSVLNASAVLYDEAWGQPADCNIKSCPKGYEERADGKCYMSAFANPNYKYTVRPSGWSGDYGKSGAFFYVGGTTEKNGQSDAAYWHERLDNVGIWLTGLPANRWWGVEKLLTFETATDVYIGHSGTKRQRILIDDQVFYEFPTTSVGNYEIWNMRSYRFTPGKHSVRVEGWADGTGEACGMQIYATTKSILEGGDANYINSKLLYSTDLLKDDPNAYFYELDAGNNQVNGNFICPEGNDVSIMNGDPDCGTKEKGTCPAGYERSPDGQSCVPIGGGSGSENPDPGLVLTKAVQMSAYSLQGAIFHDVQGNELQRVSNSPFWGTANCNTGGGSRMATTTTAGTTVATDTGDVAVYYASSVAARSLSTQATGGFCGRLNETGIWLSNAYSDKWIGFNSCLKIPATKTYYIGFGADNKMRVYIDGVLWKELLGERSASEPFLDWKVHPVNLTAGNHILTIEAMEVDNSGTYAVGLEVYNNTLAQLTSGVIDPPIYSTKNLLNGKPKDTYVKNASGVIELKRFSCPAELMDICGDNLGCGPIPDGSSLNPYVTGHLGNWLPYQQMAWLSSRTGQEIITQTQGSAGVRQNGAYNRFQAFWIYNDGWKISGDIDWVNSTTSTLYDEQSQELEAKDALGHYKAAKFAYMSQLPVAVGTNMKHREIFYDGFDDYKFVSRCLAAAPCTQAEFSIRNAVAGNLASKLNDQDAHTGNYSLKLGTDPLELKAYVYSYEHMPGIYLANNESGEYYFRTDGWQGLRGFNPVKGRKYIISAWVKGGSGTTGITATVNGTGITFEKKAVVEGWTLVEGIMDISTLVTGPEMSKMTMVLTGSTASTLIDDIRIFPYDGQLKSFTYDDRTQRVMAELDENNYATFYEYDEEGALVRVKKETERGIMTIKENRSTYKKQPL